MNDQDRWFMRRLLFGVAIAISTLAICFDFWRRNQEARLIVERRERIEAMQKYNSERVDRMEAMLQELINRQ